MRILTTTKSKIPDGIQQTVKDHIQGSLIFLNQENGTIHQARQVLARPTRIQEDSMNRMIHVQGRPNAMSLNQGNDTTLVEALQGHRGGTLLEEGGVAPQKLLVCRSVTCQSTEEANDLTAHLHVRSLTLI